MKFNKRNSGVIRQEVKKPVKLPPEATTWWWHPGRVGVRSAPGWFERKLGEVDPNLAITWNAYTQRWQVWLRQPTLQNKVCWGWMLLFPITDGSGGYAPLDERVFHRLYSASARAFGSAKAYFDSVEREMAKVKESDERSYQNDLMAEATDRFQHSQISISMHGKSRGDKFATYMS